MGVWARGVGIGSRVVGCGGDGEIGAEVARVTKHCGRRQCDVGRRELQSRLLTNNGVVIARLDVGDSHIDAAKQN